jgi:hypothetical protein
MTTGEQAEAKRSFETDAEHGKPVSCLARGAVGRKAAFQGAGKRKVEKANAGL